MAIQVLLAAASPAVRDRVGQMLAEAEGIVLAHVAYDGPGVRDALERDPDTHVVIVDAGLDEGHGHDVARMIGASFPLVGVAMLVPTAGSGELAAAMEAGARSVIAESSSLSEMVQRIEAIAQWSAAAREHVSADLTGGRGGTVVAVAGAKGGVGASVVSLLLASALTDRRTVAVVDFDLQAGDLAAYAGVHTRRSVVDLVDIAREMSGRVLRETSYDLPGGLRLLSAPNDGETAEDMTPEAARAIVNALRYQFDVAVIDVGSHLDESTAMVLEYADVAMLVATPDLPALRAARRTLALWERLAIRTPDAVDLVVNRRSPRNEVTDALAQRIVDVPVALVVPDGGAAFESAMNTASLLTTRTTAARAVGDAARAIVDRGAAPEGRPEEELVAAAPSAGGSRRSRRGRRRGDAGQASIEMTAAVLLGLLTFLVCVQGLVWAGGFLMARGAAQEGARALSVGATADQTRTTAIDEVGGPWSREVDVAVSPSDVRVSVTTPTIVPGLTWRASASAEVFQERR